MEKALATDINRDSGFAFATTGRLIFRPGLYVSSLRAFTVCAIQEARASTRHWKMA
jgi:hypothetical protein